MYESCYYKDDLLRYAEDFAKRSKRQSWREDSICKAEKRFFVGMLYVRKLLESVKITDQCRKSSVAIKRGTIRPDQEISDFCRHKVMDYLDSAEWQECKVSVDQVCDKVIHSWVNYPYLNEKHGLGGFILTTDRHRNKELWDIPAQSIIEVYTRFGGDYPVEIHMGRDENGKLNYRRIT